MTRRQQPQQLALDDDALLRPGMSAATFRTRGQTFYRSTGDPWGVAVCASGRFEGGPVLVVGIMAEDMHPLDYGPLGTLDVERVRDLHAATGHWLEQHDRPTS